jgi:hypothetical protein
VRIKPLLAICFIAISLIVGTTMLRATPAHALGPCKIVGQHDECFNSGNPVLSGGGYLDHNKMISTSAISFAKVGWIYHYSTPGVIGGSWDKVAGPVYCFYAISCTVDYFSGDKWYGDYLNYFESFEPNGAMIASDLSYPNH